MFLKRDGGSGASTGAAGLMYLLGAFDFILVLEKFQVNSQNILVESGEDLLSGAVLPVATAQSFNSEIFRCKPGCVFAERAV